MQVHPTTSVARKSRSAAVARGDAFAVSKPTARTQVRPPDKDGLPCQNSTMDDQISGFQAIGTSRYFVPSFSTWPIDGNVKWKPTTIAFSADAMS